MAIFTGRIRPSQRSTSYVEAQADGVFKNNCLSKEEQTTIDSEDWRQSSKVFLALACRMTIDPDRKSVVLLQSAM